MLFLLVVLERALVPHVLYEQHACQFKTGAFYGLNDKEIPDLLTNIAPD
jgi:hypothetical protein